MSAPAEKVDEARVTVLNPMDKVVSKAKAQALALRKRRSRSLMKRLVAFVVLPTGLAAAYFGLLASDQYESVMSFSVQSSDSRAMVGGGMEGLLAGLGSRGGNDVLIIRDYVLSRDMLSLLDKQHGFIKHYKDASKDYFSRLSPHASFEDAYGYYGQKVFAEYDSSSGDITVKVRAFSPAAAQTYVRSILTSSEEMVNKLTDRERQDRTAYAESDVKRAEQRLTDARKALVKLQQEHSDFSPLQTATSTMEIRTKIEAELARARAELMQRKAFMQDDAPQVLAAEEVVKSLSA
ncbi:MAG TPA: hypothetical protein VNG33_06245, partial [Polyangiaceae bacterium]|nr:hypothetical protein [Polyangiaceae bacterium]